MSACWRRFPPSTRRTVRTRAVLACSTSCATRGRTAPHSAFDPRKRPGRASFRSSWAASDMLTPSSQPCRQPYDEEAWLSELGYDAHPRQRSAGLRRRATTAHRIELQPGSALIVSQLGPSPCRRDARATTRCPTPHSYALLDSAVRRKRRQGEHQSLRFRFVSFILKSTTEHISARLRCRITYTPRSDSN